jgi:chromosome segregation ATPase
MGENERYNKHYVNILSSTLTETLLRNIQMQANAQFVDELVGEMNQENDSLKTQIQELSESFKTALDDRDKRIKELQTELSGLNSVKSDAENIKHQLNHLETFRNELVREREEHSKTRSLVEQLENKITDLQSPAKRKKPLLSKAELPVEDTPVKDGGTF